MPDERMYLEQPAKHCHHEEVGFQAQYAVELDSEKPVLSVYSLIATCKVCRTRWRGDLPATTWLGMV